MYMNVDVGVDVWIDGHNHYGVCIVCVYVYVCVRLNVVAGVLEDVLVWKDR